jgi:hypothetical protein
MTELAADPPFNFPKVSKDYISDTVKQTALWINECEKLNPDWNCFWQLPAASHCTLTQPIGIFHTPKWEKHYFYCGCKASGKWDEALSHALQHAEWHEQDLDSYHIGKATYTKRKYRIYTVEHLSHYGKENPVPHISQILWPWMCLVQNCRGIRVRSLHQTRQAAIHSGQMFLLKDKIKDATLDSQPVPKYSELRQETSWSDLVTHFYDEIKAAETPEEIANVLCEAKEIRTNLSLMTSAITSLENKLREDLVEYD